MGCFGGAYPQGGTPRSRPGSSVEEGFRGFKGFGLQGLGCRRFRLWGLGFGLRGDEFGSSGSGSF